MPDKKSAFYPYAANAIVAARTALVFAVISLFAAKTGWSCRLAMAGLVAAALMDWLDGHVARRLGICSKLGGLLDTLGDRITENLLLMYLAWERMVPLYVPAVFITRSFLADFVRHINYGRGYGTFAVNDSPAGRIFVASGGARAAYLVLKMYVVFAGAAVLSAACGALGTFGATVRVMEKSVAPACALLVAVSVLRFAVLVYDSRKILLAEFRGQNLKV